MKVSGLWMRWMTNFLSILCLLPITTIAEFRGQTELVRQGEPLSLKCEFDADLLINRSVIFTWTRVARYDDDPVVELVTKNEKVLADHYNLTFSESKGHYNIFRDKVQVDQDGEFFCHLKDRETNQFLYEVLIQVILWTRPSKPEILPQKLLATEDDEYWIMCLSYGYPSPNVTLYLVGPEEHIPLKAEVTRTKNMTTAIHTFKVSRFQHNQEYKCISFNPLMPNERLESTETLEVLYSPVLSVGPENPLRVELNSSVQFYCHSDANPPVKTYTWYRSGKAVHEGPVFNLNRTTIKDQGIYTCSAHNNLLRDMHAQVIVDVLTPPTITLPDQVITTLKANLSLYCKTSYGFPLPFRTVWEKEGEPTFHAIGDMLRINGVKLESAGKYVCTAISLFNLYGLEAPRQVNTSKIVKVEVKHKPGVANIFPSSQMYIVKGTNTSLFCDIQPSGYPSPVIRWWKENQGQQMMMGTGRELVLQSVQADQAGYVYCQGRNDVGRGSIGVTLIMVDTGPTLVRDLPEQIIRTVREGGEEKGEKMCVKCAAISRTHTRNYWLKDKMVIRPSLDEDWNEDEEDNKDDDEDWGDELGYNSIQSKTTYGSNGSFMVNTTLCIRLGLNSGGIYTCEFVNNFDAIESSMLLKIEREPAKVTDEEVALTPNEMMSTNVSIRLGRDRPKENVPVQIKLDAIRNGGVTGIWFWFVGLSLGAFVMCLVAYIIVSGAVIIPWPWPGQNEEESGEPEEVGTEMMALADPVDPPQLLQAPIVVVTTPPPIEQEREFLV